MMIGAVAQQTGLRASAIRYYERLGLLPPPRRIQGRRHYADDVLLRLGVIRFARQNGLTLREIQRLFAGKPYSKNLRQLAKDKVAELDRVIERAHAMQGLLRKALHCRCLTAEECGRHLGKMTQS
jgi:DNA-binding transcriptional MerR regulator